MIFWPLGLGRIKPAAPAARIYAFHPIARIEKLASCLVSFFLTPKPTHDSTRETFHSLRFSHSGTLSVPVRRLCTFGQTPFCPPKPVDRPPKSRPVLVGSLPLMPGWKINALVSQSSFNLYLRRLYFPSPHGKILAMQPYRLGHRFLFRRAFFSSVN